MKTKMLSFILSLVGICYGLNSFATARITFDLKKQTATIRANFVFFGEIREDEINEAVDVAQKLWSGEPVLEGDSPIPLEIIYQGYHLKVKADFTKEIMPSIEAAREHAFANQTSINNYVRIDSENNDFRAATNLSGNAIKLIYHKDVSLFSDLAHEFGHTLELEHWERAMKGVPSIMASRGFIGVERQYCYNPNDERSTINPKYRRVTQDDIRNMMTAFKNLKYPVEKHGDVFVMDTGWNSIVKDKYIFRAKMKKTFWEKTFGGN